MKHCGRWIIVGAFLLLPACSGKNAEVPKDDGLGKASLASRYEAAKAISSTAKKDQALAAVAADAATEGDAAVVKKCLQSINSTAAKDDAAFTAAVALAKVGKGEEAKEVAQMINSTARKDEALAKIAGGR
jgi:hypothetical protein